jgi:hypothetical protein
MTFKAYRAAPFSHAHENRIFNLLHDILQTHWGEQDEPLHLLGNFYIDGAEIDALIIKRNAVIVIDFKDYGGKLKFSENSRWTIDGTIVRGGNKTNPYQQIRDNKFQLLNYLNDRVKFQSSPNLGHIAGLCLFHQAIEFDEATLPHNISRWFHVADVPTVIRTVDAIVSSAINFSNADIDAVLSTLDVPIYHPDGRSVEVPLPPYDEGDESPLPPRLNGEQTQAIVKIKDWLKDEELKVFSLAGAFYTGKSKVLGTIVHNLVDSGKTPIYLAPNARIANRYKTKGFSDVSSIYSWLYAGRPNDIKNGKAIYPIDREPIDADKDVLVVFDAHLLGNDLFETETAVYGSGYILSDFLGSLRGIDRQGDDNKQEPIAFSEIPKILLVGDPYQLTRGARDRSLLAGQIFQQEKIGFSEAELKSQDRDNLAPVEILDFQADLIGQIKAQKFVRLPLCQQGAIKTIVKGDHTDNIAKSLMEWPRRAVYLCPTNEAAQSVNNGIRAKYLRAQSRGILVEGDIVDIHNRTPNLRANEFEQSEVEWVSSGEFARVVNSDGKVWSKSISLKGRETPVTVDFAQVTIESTGGIADIIYLPDFLSSAKPELSQDQTIALQIWAREEADEALADEKARLDAMKVSDSGYAEAHQQYKTRHSNLVLASQYSNAARLRYAYALTVHRAQAYEPLPKIILDGRRAHDTDNPATDSYFRWLYTATICTSDALQILDYPELTPLSKAQWSFGGARLVPVTFKPIFYYNKDRVPTDDELATPLPNGFSNPDPKLLSVLLTIYDLIGDSDWRVETITQHNYKERYTFANDRGTVTVDLDYNGKFDVSIGKVSVDSGSQELIDEIKGILVTKPIFVDPNIAEAVDILQDHLARKSWSLASVDEKNYKAFLIARHELGNIKLEINVPSDSSVSKKGVISSIKVQQADSETVANLFEADFGHG